MRCSCGCGRKQPKIEMRVFYWSETIIDYCRLNDIDLDHFWWVFSHLKPKLLHYVRRNEWNGLGKFWFRWSVNQEESNRDENESRGVIRGKTRYGDLWIGEVDWNE